MNARERFLAVMDFDTSVRPPKWEYAYWGETLNRWYREGLPKTYFVALPGTVTTPTASLYAAAYGKQKTLLEKGMIAPGQVVFAGGVYWPTQGVPKDRDVEAYFGFDDGVILLDVNQLFHPMFEPEAVQETERTFTYRDLDGITRVYQKNESTMPTAMDWVVKDRPSWEKLKSERLGRKDVAGRFPPDWPAALKAHKRRSYPLALGGYPHGLFGTPSHIMGYENLFVSYYDQPGLVHDILDTFTELWIRIWEEVLGQVEIDMVHFFEDVSMGTGSMISPAIFREFMMPYYRRLCSFLRSRGVTVILVDTDGDCTELVPLFLESGITGLYPMETSTGMDIRKIRKAYPRLQMLGGISKHSVSQGKASTDESLATVAALLKKGGYVPFIDHSVPPAVSWEDFLYYRKKLNSLIDAGGRR
jgi:uroporphyrinogen decarboxylase